MEFTCSNGKCKAKFLRRDRRNYLSICPYETVTCKYKDFGCRVKPIRKDLAAHEGDDKAHLRMTMDTVLAMREELKELKAKVYSLR